MNNAARYRCLILADGGSELDLYLARGGGFTRREIDAAVDLCDAKGGDAMRRLQENLERVRLKADEPMQRIAV